MDTVPVGAVLVTGCSSGIGRATALRLAAAGHVVYATARRPDTLRQLEAAGCRTLALDVTDEESRAAAVEAVEAAHGRVGALVNNAGYGQFGTIEQTVLDDVRRQFETNVFGLARLCQLVLPAMRAARTGRIVNISSVGGRIVFPVGGYYHASKWAVEAMSDALRYETEPFGIRTVLIEPGLIRTRFGDTGVANASRSTSSDDPYGWLNDANVHGMARRYRSRLMSASPERVAAVVERALTTPRPRTRYVVTPTAKVLVHTRRLLGVRAFERLIARSFPRTP